MPINIPADQVPQKPANKYASHAWASRLIKLCQVWDADGRTQRFVAAAQNGMSAQTLRAAFYTARSFINKDGNGYDMPTRALVNSVRFILTDKPADGLFVRSIVPDEIVSAPLGAEEDINDVFQQIVAWCDDTHEDGDCREWTGFFNQTLCTRVESFARQLQGMYLASIKPTSIKIIAFQSGTVGDFGNKA